MVSLSAAGCQTLIIVSESDTLTKCVGLSVKGSISKHPYFLFFCISNTGSLTSAFWASVAHQAHCNQ